MITDIKVLLVNVLDVTTGTPDEGAARLFRATPRQDPDRLTLRSKANPHREQQAVREPTDQDPRTLRADATPTTASVRQIWRRRRCTDGA
jgi:hypothetical protein